MFHTPPTFNSYTLTVTLSENSNTLYTKTRIVDLPDVCKKSDAVQYLAVLMQHVAKRSFHRSLNSIFEKCMGRIASEEVVLHLAHSKWLPSLLYGHYQQEAYSSSANRAKPL